MKRLGLFCLLVGFSFSFNSCYKEYTCTCKSFSNQKVDYKVSGMSREKAKEACNNYQGGNCYLH